MTRAPVQQDTPRLGAGVLWRLSIEQYHRMIDAGVIEEGAPVELIDGFLVTKDCGRGPGMGHGPRHAAAVRRTYRLLLSIVPVGWIVQCQLPITLGSVPLSKGGSEPEPDVAVVAGPEARYSDRHPGCADVGLLVEAADTSLDYDRLSKGRVYASAGIPRYWIVNLRERKLEVYTQPDASEERYLACEELRPGQMARLEWPGLTAVWVAVGDLFE